MSSSTQNFITIRGAKENNLKNVDLVIPKHKLVVFTGVSGSGKSSLAFNTIYEEGRRRYVDSLSSYARQFLGNTQKPLVDQIDGLSPAVAIEQKTTHNNPRSTVGTVTEVYDYLRLLFARIGKPFCPRHKIEISAQPTRTIVDTVFTNKKVKRIVILSPIVKEEKGSHNNLLEKLKKDGFLRVKINGALFSLDDAISLDKTKRHTIEIVVDRIEMESEEVTRPRLTEAVELAAEYSKGLVTIEYTDLDKSFTYSKFHSCPHGDFNMPPIEPRLFSFNSPVGMCETCKGLGVKLKADIKKMIPNPELSIAQGGIEYFKTTGDTNNLDWQEFNALLRHYHIPTNVPISALNKSEIEIILHGSDEEIAYSMTSTSGNKYQKHGNIEGIADKIERRYHNSTSEMVRTWFRQTFMSEVMCDVCKGARLNEKARAVKINNKDISEFTKMSVEDTLYTVMHLNLPGDQKQIAELIVSELYNRLTFLNNVGLDYLTLDRKAETLSGGESQRIRLATQIGSNLTGVLYVLDEPSIGLHQRDNAKLITTLKHMVDIGNTLIVVEHDEDTIRAADWIVDIGPLAGEEGGKVVVNGELDKVLISKESLTGAYLAKRRQISVPKTRRGGNGKVLEIKGAAENNLKQIDVTFPLGKLVVVTGVSGSGKSTLVNEILFKAIEQKLVNPFIIPGNFKVINGINYVDKVVQVSQSPIGRTPRSNPATYTGVFDDIRDIFTNTQLARSRGYAKGRFSFNVDGGRCEKCQGDGVIKIEMHFLPDVYITCDHCEGKRYNAETLECKYKGKSIADVLDMRVSEALDFFATHKKINDQLQTIIDVGLGYIRLGQPATTLSGGEAQRVKLATFLQKKPTGKTVYILDEPTTGLHQYDVERLLAVLGRIVDNGDTVIVIEHNLDVIKVADHIIDIGPGGGAKGGRIIATGTPEQVAKKKDSYTGQYLQKILSEPSATSK